MAQDICRSLDSDGFCARSPAPSDLPSFVSDFTGGRPATPSFCLIEDWKGGARYINATPTSPAKRVQSPHQMYMTFSRVLDPNRYK
jgi:hypothetical protein